MRRLLAVLFLAVVAAAMPGVAGAQAPARGGTLRIAGISEPPTLNPALSTGIGPAIIGAKVFSGLLEYDWDFVPKPLVAERWEVSKDGLRYTFQLRKDVTFHDGKPLTSADVKFSVESVLRPMHPRGAANFGQVEAIETPDPYTVVFRLKQPYAAFLAVFHPSESPILPKHLYENTDIRNNPYNARPVGSGPFKFVEWVKGSHVTVERNDKYFRAGQPYLDRIVWQTIPDAAGRVAAFEAGQVDAVAFSGIPNVEAARVKALPNVAYTTRGYEFQSPMMWLEMNLRRAPISDVRVRRAIAHAIDKNFVLQNIWFGIGKVATGPMSSAHKAYYTAEVPVYEYSLDKANRLLDEAGLKRGPDGVRFKITEDFLPYGDEWTRLSEYIREQLKKIGVEATIRNSDFPGFLNRVFTQYDYDIASNFVGNMSDPSIGMPRYYVSTMAKPGVPFVNSMDYKNPEIDKLFAQAAQELASAKRRQLFAQIQRTLMTDLPLLPLLELQFTTFTNADLDGVVASPFGVYDSFDRTYWKKPKK